MISDPLETAPHDPTQLSSRTILITGGSSAAGVSAAMAKRFAELGYRHLYL